MRDSVDVFGERMRLKGSLDPLELAKFLDFEADYAFWKRRAANGAPFRSSPIGKAYGKLRGYFARRAAAASDRHNPRYHIPDEWRAIEPGPPGSNIARQFAIFDDLSTYYGELYRGAAGLSYLLSALAVALALLPLFPLLLGLISKPEIQFAPSFHMASASLVSIAAAQTSEPPVPTEPASPTEPAASGGPSVSAGTFVARGSSGSESTASTVARLSFGFAELFVVLMIAAIYARGRTPEGSKGTMLKGPHRVRHRRWHDRWLDYRMLAERFRYLPLLLAAEALEKVKIARGTDNATWIELYYTWVLQDERSHHPRADPWIWQRIAVVADEQYRYHVKNAATNNRIVASVTWLATASFVGAFAGVVSHVVMLLVEPSGEITRVSAIVDPLSMFLAATLPALAAGLHGIVASGEYHKLAEQSHEMSLRLENLIVRLVDAATGDDEDDTDSETRLRKVIEQFRDITLEENAVFWRRALRDKNVPLP